MLDPEFDRHAAAAAEHYARAEPFRHAVLAPFFEADTCARLLREFPPFERADARNETGVAGGKATVERIRGLGPTFRALDELVQSPDFLTRISALTGIPELLYDPYYFGGGTHENRHGQELDPHIDFNRHPVEGWHRRLNLIVYLNPEWHADWGGALELHSDPRRSDDRVTSITPDWNRAVIFETTESSWHGFNRIVLPPDQATRSRKSIALYFYTRERPPEELAATHATVYIDRPLPPQFVAGHTLQPADVDELHALLARRDQHNARLYQDLQALQVKLEQTSALLQTGLTGRLYRLARQLLARLRK